MGRDTLRVVRVGSGHTKFGPGHVGTPSGRSGTGWDTLRKVRDGSGLPPEGPGRVKIT